MEAGFCRLVDRNESLSLHVHKKYVARMSRNHNESFSGNHYILLQCSIKRHWLRFVNLKILYLILLKVNFLFNCWMWIGNPSQAWITETQNAKLDPNQWVIWGQQHRRCVRLRSGETIVWPNTTNSDCLFLSVIKFILESIQKIQAN